MQTDISTRREGGEKPLLRKSEWTNKDFSSQAKENTQGREPKKKIPRREMESNAKRQTHKKDLEIWLIKNLKALFVKNIINNPNVLRQRTG